MKAEQPRPTISLQLLFPERPLRLEAGRLADWLRACHPELADARVEIDAATAAQGTPLGRASFRAHTVTLVGFDAPMPIPVVEQCVQPAHYKPDLKASARAHQAHVLLFYAGQESAPLERYVAVALVAGAMVEQGALIVTNEAAHTSLPASVLAAAREQGDAPAFLRSLPLPLLYVGFVKMEVEGRSGVWMRTFGDSLLGLPDLAFLASAHDQGQVTFDRFESLLRYLIESGARFAPGHTVELPGPEVFKLRAPRADEPFLGSDGEMLVLEAA